MTVSRRNMLVGTAAVAGAALLPAVPVVAAPVDPRKDIWLAHLKHYFQTRSYIYTAEDKIPCINWTDDLAYRITKNLVNRYPELFNLDLVMTCPTHLFNVDKRRTFTEEDDQIEHERINAILEGQHPRPSCDTRMAVCARTRVYATSYLLDKAPRWHALNALDPIADELAKEIRREQARLRTHGYDQCHYIPVDVVRMTDPYTFAPLIGFKARYAALPPTVWTDEIMNMQLAELKGVTY